MSEDKTQKPKDSEEKTSPEQVDEARQACRDWMEKQPAIQNLKAKFGKKKPEDQ